MSDFLKCCGTDIVRQDKKVFLRGINLGGWLMMEGYILHAPNVAEQVFKKNFSKSLGERALKDFEKSFRDKFIQKKDFAQIAQLGFNCVRLPFNSRLVEKKPYVYDERGVAYLDKAIRWAKKYGIWIILDMHAACGPQNHDWHSDSVGTADLWQSKALQERTLALWEFLANRYKDEHGVAGYDLLNEAVIDDTKPLNHFYQRVIERIRRVDSNHIIFVEGNRWAMDLDCLDSFDDDNLALSIHFYHPLDFTFNFVPLLSYPLKSKDGVFDKRTIRQILLPYVKLGRREKRPILVGEFGVNSRAGVYGEDRWLADALDCFQQAGFHWTYWTYKAVKNSIFPDGIYSFRDNPAWVNRQGPKMGWENYARCWKKQRREMIRSWDTAGWIANQEIACVLRKAAKTVC